MYKRYFRWKDANCHGIAPEWVEMTGREFFLFTKSPESKGRYFIEMDEEDMEPIVIEATTEKYIEWRKELRRRARLSKSKIGFTTISLFGCEFDTDGNGEEHIPDDTQDTEGAAMCSLQEEALHSALSLLLPEERSLLNELFLSDARKTMRELAAIEELSHVAISKRSKKILKKLNFLVSNSRKKRQ